MINLIKRIICVLIICICIVAFAFSGIYLLYNIHRNSKEDKLISELQAKKKKETNSTQNQILKEYKELYDENNDLYGWIEIEGTNINYPVMFTPDAPNFYIDKNWNKEISPNGIGTSIYISGDTKENSENTIVYGHNMKNYRLFGALELYKNENYYKDHKFIRFDTLYEKRTYEIISVSKSKVYYDENQISNNEYLFYNHIELDTEQEFNEYIKYIKNNAWYNIDETAKFKDQLLTLCTCDDWTEDGRLLIVAKRIS